MSLKIALQMDSLAPINIDRDSSFALGLEAQHRGYTLFHYLPTAVRLENGEVFARAHPVTLRRKKGNHYTFGEEILLNLKTDLDLILLRQDPPFDMSYITNTYILEHVMPHTLVLNNPTEVRNSPEKLLVTHFADLAPPTLITNDTKAIEDFYARHKDIILKPLYGNGGSQIIRVEEHSENLKCTIELFEALYKEPFIAQKYLPAVRIGDKRIVLVDGEPVAGMLRVPMKGDTRSNMAAGGTMVKSELSKRDLEICERIAPELKRRGLVFVGIDVIGDYLTEINVTSPTGIQQLDKLDGIYIPGMLWDCFEKKLKEFKAKN